MSNRWFRFLLAVFAIAAASAAAVRILQDEQRLAQDITTSRAAVLSAERAVMTVEELRAALHAYVAPGQGIAFWTARAGQLLDRLRSSLLELDAAASATGGSVGEALDMSDRLAAAEQRARDSVLKSQALLAGDVIFNDARDLLDGLRLQIARGRDQIGAASSARQMAVRREQLMLAGGAAGILVVMMLLLVPTGRRPVEPAVSPAVSAPADERSVTPAADTRPALPGIRRVGARVAVY